MHKKIVKSKLQHLFSSPEQRFKSHSDHRMYMRSKNMNLAILLICWIYLTFMMDPLHISKTSVEMVYSITSESQGRRVSLLYMEDDRKAWQNNHSVCGEFSVTSLDNEEYMINEYADDQDQCMRQPEIRCRHFEQVNMSGFNKNSILRCITLPHTW